MKRLASAALALMLGGTLAAYAQPHDDHHGKPPANHGPATPPPRPQPSGNSHPGPAMPGRPPAPAAMRGRPPGPGPAVGRHPLPHGIAVPGARHPRPMWNGHAWAVGDTFVLSAFTGPTISNWGGYALPRPRPGTHWIYVDGWYLMVGNRTGRIFSEIAADY